MAEIYDLLLSLLNAFPISFKFDVKYHISSEHKLFWCALETDMKGGSNCKGVCSSDSFSRIVFYQICVLD
jgi:hypothetical protein